MKSTLFIIFLGYLFFCALLYIFQRSFLYFPQAASQVTGVTEVKFDNKDVQLQGWVVNPGQDKALIYYGGNAEPIEYNIEFFRRLLPDWTAYLVPYRGYGNNPGEPSEAKLYQDALFVFDQVKDNHENIALMGRSLGSGIATYVADKRTVSQLILVTPYDSIENVAREHYRIFPVSLLVTDKYLSIERAERLKMPILLLVAENDQVISRERSANLAKFIKPDLLTEVTVPRADHNDISMYRQFEDRISTFLQ